MVRLYNQKNIIHYNTQCYAAGREHITILVVDAGELWRTLGVHMYYVITKGLEGDFQIITLLLFCSVTHSPCQKLITEGEGYKIGQILIT